MRKLSRVDKNSLHSINGYEATCSCSTVTCSGCAGCQCVMQPDKYNSNSSTNSTQYTEQMLRKDYFIFQLLRDKNNNTLPTDSIK